MPRVALLILFVTVSANCFSQASDFIVVRRKNNRTVKTFFPGVPISFQTYDKRQASGLITAIHSDSIFIKQWDIRPMMNSLGIPVTDTVAFYLNGFNYKEIETIDVSDRTHSGQLTPGRILIIGGIGYTALNLINGAYLHESITSAKNLKSLGIAAGAVGTGLLVNYFIKHGRKYRIDYIRMNEIKKRGF